METTKKINSLSFLRGIAVIGVCFCHFGASLTKGNTLAPLFNAFFSYGKYGVHVFFVVSGFIIPLSMDKARYALKYYFRFLSKRIVRLHPPYLVALALSLVMLWFSDRLRHLPYPENSFTFLQSFFYMHEPDGNPVFWTLRIEMEYYLFMGLFFVLLKKYTRLTLLVALPIAMILSQTLIVHYIELFDYLIFFLVGTLGYLIYQDKQINFVNLSGLLALLTFSFFAYDFAPALIVLLTIAFILLYKRPVHKIFDFTGEISYSLYLIHCPIGVKMVNLSVRYINIKYAWVMFLAAFIAAYLSSILFWRLIERPFTQLSNKIRYGDRKSLPKPLPLSAN